MIKTKYIELDVDIIGGQGPLTEDEEKAIIEYFKQRENIKTKTALKSIKTVKHSK